ncbi:MAG: C39 family peptidase [Cyanobacteriota bacterium]|nr:C39 family peptidase [Cyanobacteriota bacterium]
MHGLQRFGRRRARPLGLVGLAGLAIATPALAQQAGTSAQAACSSMGAQPVQIVTLSVLAGSLIALTAMERRLRAEGWSLAHALSEPIHDSESPHDPSSSRLIAMAGMLVILLLYLGFGVFALYNFGMTCTMPASTSAVTGFLYSGLTLFAPYIANKFSNVFRPMAGHGAGPANPPATPEAAAKVVPAPAAAAPSASTAYEPAIALIAQFEGFVDHAYPDPASGGEPWTIGFGFTQLHGRPVQPGDTLSRTEGDALLRSGVDSCAAHLANTIPYWGEMARDQRCALISFAWNLGENFYGDDSNFHTISTCLRSRAWNQVPDALLLYCNPGTAVEAGLRRRRQAEADLWRQGMATKPAPAPTPAPAPAAHPNPLPVPWYDQLQMDDGQGWRDCFSASSAMLAAFWGKEPNENTYNHLRQRYGDSTSSEAQLAALRHLGLQAEFRTDGTLADLKKEIDAGRPVAVGWLHHGPPSAPSGGGHWTVVIGYDASGVIMNDPYGSCDLVHGGYPANHNGARQHYSYKNWQPRWQPQGSGGWYLRCWL